MADFSESVDYVLEHEGGISENPNDPGGITKYGISFRFLKSLPLEKLRSYGVYVSETIAEDDIRELTLDQAKAIYKGEFWDHAPFEQLTNQKVANYIFDTAVNMGIAPAVKCAQRACWSIINEYGRIVDDGILGESTLKYINGAFPSCILYAMRSERAGYYRLLVECNPSQREFLDGWLKRSYGG
jgi:lysozyme family protein